MSAEIDFYEQTAIGVVTFSALGPKHHPLRRIDTAFELLFIYGAKIFFQRVNKGKTSKQNPVKDCLINPCHNGLSRTGWPSGS